MTMQHQIHPDDERLAALAGADPDVAADTELRAHVSACPQCTGVVDELTTLQSALAELPDLVPSRRLQLIPPVAEPRAKRSGWMRRLAAPVMAGGFALVMVGAIGTSGVLNAFSNAGQFQNVGDNPAVGSPLDAAGEEVSPRSLTSGGDTGAPGSLSSEDGQQTRASDDESTPTEPIVTNTDTNREIFSNNDPRLPWLVLIGLGVGVLLAGLYLRFSAESRAG
ncbi:MAG TPA: hypothetical protein VFH90_05855 [Candidatus Limnocylindria bacterium]|nr:hypothetical protein [Candidatus Limnocylindria bacterium]